jgi:CDP-diacylglycerol--glycerol-3-phosphate 3-phosphatidyltransferase
MWTAFSRTIVDTMATSLGESASPVSAPESREHFWNLPNTITVLRTLVVPLLVAFPLFATPAGSRFMAWAFIVAALGDLVDGWLARRGQQVTSIGKLLDPLADKLTASTALVVLLAIGRIPLLGLPLVVVIIGRELAVTGLRGIASAHGHVVAARGLGKIKTLAQNVAIACLLFPTPTLGLPAHALGLACLTLATGLTLWSGYAYFADYFRAESRRARAPESDR